MKSKVCIVMKNFFTEHIGGAEVQAYLLAKELARRDWEVHYICESKANNEDTTSNFDGFTVHWLKRRRYFDFLNFFKLFLILKRINPPFIYNRFSSAYTGIVGFYAKIYHSAFIWVCTDNNASKKLSTTKYALNSFHNHKYDLAQKSFIIFNSLLKDLFISYGLQFVDLAIALSEKEEQQIKKNFKFQNTLYLRVGHYLPEYTPDKLRANKVILWAGNLGIDKWPEGFIEIAKSIYDPSVEFWVLGDHANQKRKEAVMNSAKGKDNIKFFFNRKFDDTHEIYDKAKLFINTTTIPGGGIGNTNAQALIRGIPIISITIDPGNVIKEFNAGILSRNIEQASRDVIKLMCNDYTYMQYSQNARSFAENFLSIENAVDRLIAKLKTLNYH